MIPPSSNKSAVIVKIAFANWKSRGKQDIELHEGGYDLIHVPVGRDHADGKMLLVGASIRDHYPAAREVLVCSSDTVMTNLCNQLQKSGLTVYHVRRQGVTVTASNCQSGETQFYTIKPQIPTPEEFIKQLKALIRAVTRVGWEGTLTEFLQRRPSFMVDGTGKQVTLAQH